MTLSKSIIVSLMLHMLLIGTGLAITRWTGMFRQPQSIMVTLVGNQPTATAGGIGKRMSPVPAKKAEPAEKPEQKNAAQKTSVPELESEPRQEPAHISSHAGSGPEGSEDAGTREANSSGPAQSDGDGSANISSDQWAVIVSSIERVKNYPRLARERGIEGVVRLRFRMKPQGQVDRVEIVKSSGYDILDSASVKTLYRAGPMPYVSGWLEVPIAYLLK